MFFTILTNKTLPNLPSQGGEAPWLGRLGRVLLVRIVKNVVVYSSANSLNAIYWEILTTFVGGRLQVNDKRKVFPEVYPPSLVMIPRLLAIQCVLLLS